MNQTVSGVLCPFCHQMLRMGSRYCGYCGLMVAGSRRCPACGGFVPGDFRWCDTCGRPLDGTVSQAPGQSASQPQAVAGLADLPEPPGVPSTAISEPVRSPDESPPRHHAGEGAPHHPADGDRGKTEERRLATVMFADVSGFTHMSESMDPEEVKDVMNEVFGHLSRVIEQNGGGVDKYIGDCIMAVFGAPHSYGDDAERAVRAALKMQSALESLSVKLEPRVGVHLRIRIGLNTGLVSAGRVGGEGQGRYTVMGDTVNLANRMESSCAVGRVLVSCNTQRFIADHFVLEDAGRIKVKGKTHPIQAYYAVRERLGRMDDWAFQIEGIPIPFISRNRELNLMEHVFSKVCGERCVRAAVVSAPSGYGKSRFIAEFCRRARGERPGVQILRESEPAVQIIHSRATVNATRMEPIARMLRENLALADESLADAVARAVGEGFAAGGGGPDPDLEGRAVKSILELLDEAAEPDLAQADDESRTRILMWSLKMLFQGMASGGPILMIISDYHLADEITLALVRHLVETAPDRLEMMVVLEMHPGDHETEWRLTEREDRAVVQIALSPLNEPEVIELLSGLLAPCGHVPQWVSRWVVNQCNGIPFYVVEMVRSLIAMGVLRHDDETGRWHIGGQAPIDLRLPPTIHGALQAVVDHLPVLHRQVLCTAAHIGDVFWDKVLFELLRQRAPDGEVAAALNNLRAKGVLRRRQNSLIAGATEYRFASEMVFKTCYEMLPIKQRREVYHSCAARLEALGAACDNPALVARHWEGAGETARAVALYLDAIEKNLCLDALQAADGLLGKCDELCGPVEPRENGGGRDQEEGLERRVADRSIRARLELCRASYQRRAGKLDDALESCARGLSVLGAAERRDGEAGVGNGGALQSRLCLQMGLICNSRGNHRDALSHFDSAIACARDAESEIAAMTNLKASRCWSLLQLGRGHEAEGETREILKSFNVELIDDGDLCNAVARHLDTLGEIHKRRKELDVAATCYMKARKLRERQGNLRLLSVSDNNLAIVKAMHGDWRSARDAFARVLSSRKTHGDPYDIAVAMFNLAESHFELGERDQALARLGEASNIARQIGSKALVEEISKLEKKFP